MSFKQNRFYNSPEIGAAFNSIGEIFAPPSAQDAYAYASASEKRQKMAQLADLFTSGASPSEKSALVGIQEFGATPEGFNRKVDLDNATQRYGHDQSLVGTKYGADRTFDASRANNADTLKKDITVSMLAPVAEGATRFVPPSVASMYDVGPTQTGVLKAGQGDTLVAPGGQRVVGSAKPLTEEQVKGGERERLAQSGLLTDQMIADAIVGQQEPVMSVGADGKTQFQTRGAAVRTKAQPAADVTKVGEQAGKLRGEIVQLPSYKNWSQAAPIYKSMLETAGTNTRASDLNLIYATGKIMDPGSVVREGEQVMVANTAALPDWLIGAANRLNGGATLQPETRAALLAEAHNRMRAYEDVLSPDLDRYGAIADRSGVRRDDVLPPFERSKPYARPAQPKPAAAAPSAPSEAADLPTPQTPAEFDALPSGARYRDPDDGKPYRKP